MRLEIKSRPIGSSTWRASRTTVSRDTSYYKGPGQAFAFTGNPSDEYQADMFVGYRVAPLSSVIASGDSGVGVFAVNLYDKGSGVTYASNPVISLPRAFLQAIESISVLEEDFTGSLNFNGNMSTLVARPGKYLASFVDVVTADLEERHSSVLLSTGLVISSNGYNFVL